MEQQNQEQKKQPVLTQQELLQKAYETLQHYVMTKTKEAGFEASFGEKLWDGLMRSPGLMQELAYYHDYGNFLCKYKIAGYTLTDVLVWQVDHFKLYMDRPEEMNRFKQERLLLASLMTMVEMEQDPAAYAEKMTKESGQDIANG